jgi:uncharacterized membrane protein
MKTSSIVWRTVGLGAISGLRSTSGPALLSRAASRGGISLQDTPFRFLASRKLSTLLQLALLGELTADKLPVVPPRTALNSLIGRAVSGALVGTALFASEKRALPAGALIGGLSAVGAALAGENLRAAVVEKTGAPDPIIAAVEDAITLTVGTRSLRT